jgi:hypothetical protein
MRGTSVEKVVEKARDHPAAAAAAGVVLLGAAIRVLKPTLWTYLSWGLPIRISRKVQLLLHEKKVEEQCVEYVFKHATPGDAESVMNKIDEFCHRHGFMMNVGDEKGLILDRGQLVTKIA